MATELKCPNCGTPAAIGKEGVKIVCSQCGGTFEYSAGEAKLTAVGEIDKIRTDVEELKQRLPASVPAAQPPEDPSATPDSPFDDDEDLTEDDDEDDL
jgi:uncharacterized Zn finger protein (UPF0148 family)